MPAEPRPAATGRERVGRPARARWSAALLHSWLTFRVHADAFRFDPLGYMQAVAWRARGLRVRSRHRISALAGRSSHAYALWIAREEPKAWAAIRTFEPLGEPAVLPVIDCRGGVDGIEQTVASVAEAGGDIQPVAIGGPPATGAVLVGNVRQLGDVIEGADIWLCVLSAGDRLAPGALAAYAAAAKAQDASLIYADDDLIGPDGARCAPHFKPRWNPDLFEHHDFISGASIVRVSRDRLSCLPDNSWLEALVDEALQQGGTPLHLPLVLHHRRQRPLPRVPAKPSRLLAEAMPTITVIVPTRNKVHLLRNCIEGLSSTAYPKLDVIVVDNGSDDPGTLDYLKALETEGVTVLRIGGPFNFSALNNAAAREASGELLCFLNNDVEMIDPDWLSLLVRQATRPDLGAVGARLLYPDGTVQHAGVFTGIGGGAGHGHKFQGADEPGYFERARLPQQVSAVTAACLVVARDKFLSVGGFDEQEFPVAFNDVDLCLKLNARGWQSFYEPRATLIHHESKSRGKDCSRADRARFADELAALRRKWRTDVKCDPYHHPHLSQFCEQFLVAV